MNKKELIEIQIANLQGQIKEKQKKLEELSQTKSPEEEAFKRVYSYYPEGCETSVWVAFQKGYEQSQKDCKVGEFQEKDKMSLYERFVNEGAYGQLYYDNAIKVVKDFLLDEGVIEDESGEYITFTLQKSLLEVPND